MDNNQDIKLYKIGTDKLSDELRYQFAISQGSIESWKQKYKTKCIIMRKKPLEQGNLSYKEYYIEATRPIESENISNYFLLVNNIPVTHITLTKESNTIEISFATSTKYQGQGFATLGVVKAEELVFQNPSIEGSKMIDMSNNKQTEKIANSLGYTSIDNGIFYKPNPNYKKQKSIKMH